MMLISGLMPALVLGLLSSLHCAGMCGAIAFSLPVHHLSATRKSAGVFLYHAGRIFTYVLLGFIVGILGWQLRVAGFQKMFSISLGLMMILWVLFAVIKKQLPAGNMLKRFQYSLMMKISVLLRRTGIGNLFLLGMANGLLPCGMVYFAITAAFSMSSLTEATIFMLLFGIGTLPAMLFFSLAGYRAGVFSRKLVKRIGPVLMVVMGSLLILRGIGLHIPYISPTFTEGHHQVIGCGP